MIITVRMCVGYSVLVEYRRINVWDAGRGFRKSELRETASPTPTGLMATIISAANTDRAVRTVRTELRESQSESMESVCPRLEIQRHPVENCPDEVCTVQVYRYRRLGHHFQVLGLQMGRRKSRCPPVILDFELVRLRRRRLGCIV